MNITIPFTKEILFKSKIAEICSISLEDDVSINDNELLGDFIISGDYKNLDINVDSMPFSHVVPFSVSLEDNIKIDTLSYEIADFNYEIVGDDILKVMISFHVEALKEDEKFDDIFEKVEEREPVIVEQEKDLDVNLESNEDLVVQNDVTNKNNDDIRDKLSIFNSDDLSSDYITYHVHTIKINETIETISKEFNISKDDIINLNGIDNVNVGDKLIIPIIMNE